MSNLEQALSQQRALFKKFELEASLLMTNEQKLREALRKIASNTSSGAPDAVWQKNIARHVLAETEEKCGCRCHKYIPGPTPHFEDGCTCQPHQEREECEQCGGNGGHFPSCDRPKPPSTLWTRLDEQLEKGDFGESDGQGYGPNGEAIKDWLKSELDSILKGLEEKEMPKRFYPGYKGWNDAVRIFNNKLAQVREELLG